VAFAIHDNDTKTCMYNRENGFNGVHYDELLAAADLFFPVQFVAECNENGRENSENGSSAQRN
jgi:hypothetical protein